MVHAPAVILATGGLGHLYSATTNPEGSTGDGIALALWAGVGVSDIEFIQFHPTMLFDRDAARPAPADHRGVARRGRGAARRARRFGHRRRAPDGRPRAARRGRGGHRGPTAGDRGRVRVSRRAFHRAVRAALPDGHRGLPRRRDRPDPANAIPVVPGAHYSCGGVLTDVYGRTELAGLFAAGEVARTGMHGANRLASNSLLEGLVVGGRAGKIAAEHALVAEIPMAEAEPAQRDTLDRRVLQQRDDAVGVGGAGRRRSATGSPRRSARRPRGRWAAGPTSRTPR